MYVLQMPENMQAWCSSPKGKPWISHNTQLQHNTITVVLSFPVTTGTQTLNSRTMELCQHAGGFQCLQIWVILVSYGRLNLWHYKIFSVVWFPLFLSKLLHPIISDGMKGCIQCSQEKRGSLRTGENGQISPGFSFLLILTPCHTYTQTCT